MLAARVIVARLRSISNKMAMAIGDEASAVFFFVAYAIIICYYGNYRYVKINLLLPNSSLNASFHPSI